MEIQMEPRQIRAGIIAFVALILLIVFVLAFRAGRDFARGEFTEKQAVTILEALGRFYADQDRFPTNSEFSDAERFGQYLSVVPLPLKVSKKCPVPLSYETLNQRTFVLTYCLPREMSGLPAGSYELTERDVVNAE